MDTSKAGKVIAGQMDALEHDYGDKEGYEIGAVVTIIEVKGPGASDFRMRNNIGNPIVMLGVLRIAEDEWLRSMRTVGGLQRGQDL